MTRSLLSILTILFLGAIFGFFYAWICSTLWGLDTLPPAEAIAAMNAMNASVRNGVFAPAFFGTPLVAALTALAYFRAQDRRAAGLFALAGLVYLLGGIGLTVAFNVPMNTALAALDPADIATDAAGIWETYSTDWMTWNITRTIASGAALVLATLAILLRRPAY